MRILLVIYLFVSIHSIYGQDIIQDDIPRKITVANGWAKNSVNAVAYRHNALTTYKDIQYIAFYDTEQNMVLGKRKLGSSTWDLNVTQYKGNATDAHNSISIAVDGAGYLHVAWDHHNNPLRYCKSLRPGSLELSEKLSMSGLNENKVTYPEFFRMPGGDLMFLYRDGSSGNGNLMMNYYDNKKCKWSQIQNGLINGEGERNAYTQMTVDKKGNIYLAWVWRETGDVATNHDICYATSSDRGKTWKKSTGEKYMLPITISTAEYVYKIPEKSELINPPTIATDNKEQVFISTYWREADSKVPQYRIIYNSDGGKWICQQITHRDTPFTLSGGGTKRIPIARPQLMVSTIGDKQRALLVFRDEERGSKATVAVCDDLLSGKWRMKDLTSESLGQWEPNYDIQLWKQRGILNLFIQKVEQGDAETLKDIPPQEVSVLEWKPHW